MRRARETTNDAAGKTDGGASSSDADMNETATRAEELETYEDEDESADDDEEARGRRRGEVSSRVIDALPGSPQFWVTVCAACLIVSAALVLNGRAEAAFVTATIGVLAWFINVRNRLREDDAPTTNSGGRRESEHESNGVRND